MGGDMGLLFDVGKSQFGAAGLSFAQGPKVLKFETFTRVYFASRPPPTRGQYVSEIHFADFSPDFDCLLNLSERPVVSAAGLGTFDEHGIFPLEVIKFEQEILGFSGGWARRQSVPVDMAIGRLVSLDNGISFVRDGDGPVLASSPSEPFLIGDPCVVGAGGLLHMFYIFGTKWTISNSGIPERTYLIGHRVSSSGLDWTKPSTGELSIIPTASEWEAQAMPSVVNLGGLWFMFFCYRETFGFRERPENAYRMGIAVSEDLSKWRRLDEDFEHLRFDWNSEMMCYPNAHVRGEKLILLYNGNFFGRSGFGGASFQVEDLIKAASRHCEEAGLSREPERKRG